MDIFPKFHFSRGGPEINHISRDVFIPLCEADWRVCGQIRVQFAQEVLAGGARVAVRVREIAGSRPGVGSP